MATDNENNLQRRLEDQHPDATIAWDQPGAPAVPLSSIVGAAKGGNTSEEIGGAASIPPSTAPAPQTKTLADDDRYQHVRDLLLDSVSAANKDRLHKALDLLSDLADTKAAPAPQQSESIEPPPLPKNEIAYKLGEAAANPSYSREECARWMQEGSDAVHALAGWAARAYQVFAKAAQAAPSAPTEKVEQGKFAERLYGPKPTADERRDALHTLALIFAAAETDSAREACFEDMYSEFLAVPRMSIFDGLTRHTGAEISTNYTFETEEFFEVEAVERVLRDASKAAPSAKAEPVATVLDDLKRALKNVTREYIRMRAKMDGLKSNADLSEYESIVCVEEARKAMAKASLAAPAPAVQAEDVRNQAKWISVDERLPEGRYCLAVYKTPRGQQRVIRAMYVRQFEVEATGDECDSEYNEANDREYLKAGWLECIDNWGEYSSVYVTEGTVTHWMPLPAAPSTSQTSEGADRG